MKLIIIALIILLIITLIIKNNKEGFDDKEPKIAFITAIYSKNNTKI